MIRSCSTTPAPVVSTLNPQLQPCQAHAVQAVQTGAEVTTALMWACCRLDAVAVATPAYGRWSLRAGRGLAVRTWRA